MALSSTDSKGKYLYVIWSKQFDIDGSDTLYKFGMTTKIHERKFNSCYTTAFKYPCEYKQWYEITSSHHVQFCEAAVLKSLKNYRAREPLFNDYGLRIDKGGTELFNICLSKLTHICESTLNSNDIIYRKYTKDEFVHPKYQIKDEIIQHIDFTQEEIDNCKIVISIRDKLNKHENLIKEELDFIKDQDWIFNHHKKKHENHRCCMCNYPLRKEAFVIVNIKWDLQAYTGSDCIHKVPNLEYISPIIKNKIKEYGYRDPIKVLINSDDRITKLMKDPCQIIYSYSVRSSGDEVSSAHIKKDEEWKLIRELPDYDPKGTCCAIISWMYRNNHTYCTISDIKKQIIRWNVEKNKAWGIESLTSYLTHDEHDELEYDNEKGIFIYKKYYDKEKGIVEMVKELQGRPNNIVDGVDDYINELIEKRNEYVGVTELQMETLKHIEKNTISILTGVAGSGKSDTSTLIAKFMDSKGYKVIQLAPTGKASSVITEKNKDKDINFKNTAYTIHSKLHTFTSPLEKTFVHIDECGMLDTEMMYKFLQKISFYENVKILITGDENQISPVGFGSPFVYLKQMLKDSHNDLPENVRSDCTELTNFIKSYKFLMKSVSAIDFSVNISFLKKIVNKNDTGNNHIKIVPYTKENLNKFKKEKYKFITYRNTIREEIIKVLKDKPDDYVMKNLIGEVKKYDKIMILKNGYVDGTLIYFNGQEITVKEVKRDNNIITGFIPTEGKEINFKKKHLEMELSDLICYSDCITIHKSQGSGINNICLILKGECNLDFNFIYTAITRSKQNLVIMYCDDWKDKSLIVKPRHHNTLFKYFVSGKIYENKSAEIEVLKQKLIEMLGWRDTTGGVKWKIHNDQKLHNKYDLGYLKTRKYMKDYGKFEKLYKKLERLLT
jgi:hypothetical protein